MAEGDGCEESLFSLEFLVESANVEPRLVPAPVPACGPFRLAVALRLLDFPTLLVRAPHCGPGPVVPFGRGKSCLFKLRPDALKSLLRRSPLCALLLALPPMSGAARLLGSSSVSLASAAEELLLGSGPGGRRGRFPLRDLMGEFVGELGLSYRLSNLGAALLGHLGQGAAPGEPQHEEPQQKPQELLFMSPPPPPPSPRQLPSIQGESGLNLELIPEGEEEQDPAAEGGSLRSFRSSSSSSAGSQPRDLNSEDQVGELEAEANVFCPPPLYYSHTPGIPSPTPVPKPVIVAAPPKSSKKKEVPIPPALPVQKEPSSGAQETSPSPAMPSNPEMLKQTLNQLPLLNALLVELSLLNNQALEPGPCTVHPQLAWLYRNIEDGTTKPPSPSSKSLCPSRDEKKTSHHRKERERSPSPKLKKNRPDHLRCLSPSIRITYTSKGYPKFAGFERPGSPEKYNTKENTPPRRKLTYGLTNTLRLRLQRANPSMLIPHENRDHHRKKHTEVLMEKKGKSSSVKVKTPRSSPERRQKSSRHPNEKVISDQNVQFNDNIETLIQSSADQDCYTTIKEGCSDLQSNVIATSMKNSKNAEENGPTEVTETAHIEKCLKIHLPRVTEELLKRKEELQVTDIKNKTNVEAEKCVQDDNCNITTLHNPSQSNNFENNQELKTPNEVVASSENTVYSDDFTGTDSSGTSLDAPGNSSDPLEENSEQNQSVTDSDAKMSERSLTPETVSPPLPIPSAISPVQSLKKTSDLKSSGKNTGLSELDGDDSPCARTVEKELAAQHIKKEGRKEVEKLEGKQVSFDVDGNLSEDPISVEKSQSLRTSQVSSYLPSNVSDLDLSGLDESKTSEKEKEDNSEMLDVINQCRHVSELVVNNLPGYTM
ncbi:microtubule-associated protein 10 [Tiliqua scincoides]|uniref:microtubule-associated protein 10 n=1 Tax=Tiliqua scincoides TaxID=71010 RepID=UPI0034622BE1